MLEWPLTCPGGGHSASTRRENRQRAPGVVEAALQQCLSACTLSEVRFQQFSAVNFSTLFPHEKERHWRKLHWHDGSVESAEPLKFGSYIFGTANFITRNRI